MTVTHLLIGTDGTPGGRAAVSEGLALARSLGASVTFVAVHPRVSALAAPYYQRRLTEHLASSSATIEAALAEADRLGVAADSEVVEGDPPAELLRLAGSYEADMIIVGSRGLGALAGALLGSVSRWLVTHADIPVLVVKERNRPD
jgi:nucleotide-binding universal stress UspA family protein